MYKRFELHNHTSESDSGLSCSELIELMVKDKVDVAAITDHNTISGHRIIRKLLEEGNYPISFIYGMEYTTYYGHILCLNLKEYVPWDSIDINRPELLFRAVRASGAIAGIAHPYSYGYPFARGCGFDMTVTDFSCVDFIEIFNDPEPLHEVNEKGLLWWKKLVLSGRHLAATCGMDLHGDWDMSMQYATYVKGTKDGDPETELADAIKECSTYVSKGILLCSRFDPDTDSYVFSLEDVKKPGYVYCPADQYKIVLTCADRTITRNWSPTDGAIRIPASELNAPVWIPELYAGEAIIENLICVSPLIFR